MTKTAIILFAHLPDFEARAKSFSGISSQRATKKISDFLTQHFYTLSKQTSADSFLIDSHHQKGKSFGERITNAFESIYAKGYENVICIGNDCPNLSLQQLQSAISSVEKGNVVLGPTFDGGTYLIGIPKSHFDTSSFRNVKWQSRLTYRQLKSTFCTPVEELNLEVDVDSPSQIIAFSAHNELIEALRNIVLSFKQVLSNLVKIPFTDFFSVDSSSLTSPPLNWSC